MHRNQREFLGRFGLRNFMRLIADLFGGDFGRIAKVPQIIGGYRESIPGALWDDLIKK